MPNKSKLWQPSNEDYFKLANENQRLQARCNFLLNALQQTKRIIEADRQQLSTILQETETYIDDCLKEPISSFPKPRKN